jgi:hypothetical protein
VYCPTPMDAIDPLESPISGLLAWSMAVLTTSNRLLTGSQTRIDRSADALLLMLSLRNLVRAAEWGANTARGAGQEAARRQAVAEFRQQLPNVVDARDVLEHFDDYATGRGRLQQRAVQQGQDAAKYSFAVAVDGNAVVIAVGAYRFDVRSIRDACRELAIVILSMEEQFDTGETPAALA